MKTGKPPLRCLTLEENLKKALTELLILHLLNVREYYIGELTQDLSRYTDGALKLAFPYSAVYRLQHDGYIVESEKRVAEDGRRRQFYQITQRGQDYHKHLLATYREFIASIDMILNMEL